ncbi:hypothetical protein ES703_75473 [subsurface metagenome]
MKEEITMEKLEKVPQTLDEWIECVKQDFVGKPVPEVPLWNYVTTLKSLICFAGMCGDDNPLFTDATYAPEKWGGLIASPTYPISVKVPTTPEVGYRKGIPMTEFDSEVELENYDVIRIGDSFRAEKIITGVEKKVDKNLGPSAVVSAKTTIWNQNNEVVAKMTGSSLHPQKVEKGKMLYNRSIHKYPEEEKEKLIHDIEGEPPRRGSETLYWEDVKVGEKLPQKVKGPLDLRNLENIKSAIYGNVSGTFRLSYKNAIKGEPSIHPITGWLEPPVNEHLDWVLCKNRGMPLPFDFGVARGAMAYHILTDWMGDDGFVRRLKTEITGPFFYSDTLWMTGEVVKKEKTAEGTAVDIEIKMTNQLGELITLGSATVLLPSRSEGPVRLPISP